MKAATIGAEDVVEELLVVLDEDIRLIQRSLSQLNELRSLVIKRDEVALGRLLERIQVEAPACKRHDSKRQSIRKELARALGCDYEQMTLSRLESVLPGEEKSKVAERKARLRSLTEELKKEHLSTALLLSECARFNNVLLRSVLGLGRTETLIYDSNGAASRQTDKALVNLQF
jgi:flagellar biosynthesis/type III secretory pathway chaperone